MADENKELDELKAQLEAETKKRMALEKKAETSDKAKKKAEQEQQEQEEALKAEMKLREEAEKKVEAAKAEMKTALETASNAIQTGQRSELVDEILNKYKAVQIGKALYQLACPSFVLSKNLVVDGEVLAIKGTVFYATSEVPPQIKGKLNELEKNKCISISELKGNTKLINALKDANLLVKQV